MLKNIVETAPIAVTPVLYMADGTEYDLPQVQLDPAGVAMVNVKDALQNAPANIVPHLSAFGSAGIRFQWAWPAIFSAMRNTDENRGLIYLTHLESDAAQTHDPTAAKSQQVIESTWWKQDPDVAGFLTMMNTSLDPVTVNVKLTTSGSTASAAQQFSIPPHNTRWLDFTALWAQLHSNATEGGIEISYSAPTDAISLTGGMEDSNVGYSHMLHFVIPAPAPQQPAIGSSPAPRVTTFDSVGIMVGSQDPDMQFPTGTVFTPYVVLRNTTAQAMQVQLAANVMANGSASDLTLGTVALAPLEARQIDMKSMLKAANLGSYNGYLNLRTIFTGTPTDLLQESGSLDQTLNYVFEVPPRLEETTPGRIFNYWNSSGDTDTMFTLWNYSDTPQDIIFTFQHQEGKYELPIHLAPHASQTLSVAKLIRSGVPDRNGVTIPGNIVQGSARFSGLNGHRDHLTVAVSAGVFNARTGTCSYPCGPCDGLEFISFGQDEFDLPIGGSQQATVWATYTDGNQENVTADAGVSSQNTSIATYSSPNVSGVAVGATNLSADFASTGTTGNGPHGYSCCGVAGCGTSDCQAQAPTNVGPQITSITPTQGPIASTSLKVTINGMGFGTNPTVCAGACSGSGITVTISSASDTQIVAFFKISTSDPGGNHSVTVQATSTGPSSNGMNFYVQIPTSLSPPSVVVISDSADCSTNPFGIMITATYIVMDQRTPAQAIASGNMEPQEQISNVFLNGVAKPGLPYTDFVAGGFTNADGSFSDTPLGSCADFSFTQTDTQDIQILINSSPYHVRTNNFTTKGLTSGHGSISNGGDISASK